MKVKLDAIFLEKCLSGYSLKRSDLFPKTLEETLWKPIGSVYRSTFDNAFSNKLVEDDTAKEICDQLTFYLTTTKGHRDITYREWFDKKWLKAHPEIELTLLYLDDVAGKGAQTVVGFPENAVLSEPKLFDQPQRSKRRALHTPSPPKNVVDAPAEDSFDPRGNEAPEQPPNTEISTPANRVTSLMAKVRDDHSLAISISDAATNSTLPADSIPKKNCPISEVDIGTDKFNATDLINSDKDEGRRKPSIVETSVDQQPTATMEDQLMADSATRDPENALASQIDGDSNEMPVDIAIPSNKTIDSNMPPVSIALVACNSCELESPNTKSVKTEKGHFHKNHSQLLIASALVFLITLTVIFYLNSNYAKVGPTSPIAPSETENFASADVINQHNISREGKSLDVVQEVPIRWSRQSPATAPTAWLLLGSNSPSIRETGGNDEVPKIVVQDGTYVLGAPAGTYFVDNKAITRELVLTNGKIQSSEITIVESQHQPLEILLSLFDALATNSGPFEITQVRTPAFIQQLQSCKSFLKQHGMNTLESINTNLDMDIDFRAKNAGVLKPDQAKLRAAVGSRLASFFFDDCPNWNLGLTLTAAHAMRFAGRPNAIKFFLEFIRLKSEVAGAEAGGAIDMLQYLATIPSWNSEQADAAILGIKILQDQEGRIENEDLQLKAADITFRTLTTGWNSPTPFANKSELEQLTLKEIRRAFSIVEKQMASFFQPNDAAMSFLQSFGAAAAKAVKENKLSASTELKKWAVQANEILLNQQDQQTYGVAIGYCGLAQLAKSLRDPRYNDLYDRALKSANGIDHPILQAQIKLEQLYNDASDLHAKGLAETMPPSDLTRLISIVSEYETGLQMLLLHNPSFDEAYPSIANLGELYVILLNNKLCKPNRAWAEIQRSSRLAFLNGRLAEWTNAMSTLHSVLHSCMPDPNIVSVEKTEVLRELANAIRVSLKRKSQLTLNRFRQNSARVKTMLEASIKNADPEFQLAANDYLAAVEEMESFVPPESVQPPPTSIDETPNSEDCNT